MNQKISQNIVKLRKEKNITQTELANEINYSDKVISKWERGESIPNVEALVALADYFGVTTDSLLNNEKFEQNHQTVSLDVKENGKPSLLFRLSILVPLLAWIIVSFFGPMYFVIGGLVFLVYWIIYALLQLNGTFEATYLEHTIRVSVKAKGINMYIDDILVDAIGMPMMINYHLKGKIEGKTVRAKISIFLFSKCIIFID